MDFLSFIEGNFHLARRDYMARRGFACHLPAAGEDRPHSFANAENSLGD
jgi:hypothetical protein